jgi:hypothetical protein
LIHLETGRLLFRDHALGDLEAFRAMESGAEYRGRCGLYPFENPATLARDREARFSLDSKWRARRNPREFELRSPRMARAQ